MAKNSDSESHAINMISRDTLIEGHITSVGDIRIDGTLKGTVSSQGKVVVGETGRVEGEIHCENADISGEIKVKINVSQLLFLKSSARLKGDIVANKLAIEAGASFSGSCSMEKEGNSDKQFEANGHSLKPEKEAV